MANKFNVLVIGSFMSVFLSCGTTQKNDKKEEVEEQNIQKDTLSFMEIISVVPDVKLPYTMWCGIENDNNQYPDTEELGSDIANLLPKGDPLVIVGKLPINNDKIYLLYGLVGDIIYPYLNIYDKKGKKIDSLYLHIGYCAGDENEIRTTATTINKDFSIHMTDTMQYHRDIGNNEGYEWIIDSIIVTTHTMNLTKDGYYKVVNETQQKTQ